MKTKQIIGLVVAISVIVVAGFCWQNGMFRSAQTYPDYSPGAHEIIDTKWVWEKTEMNDGTITVPRKAEAFTITFQEDGNLSGTTDCNGFFGLYSADRGALTIGPLGMTKMYCEGSQEAEFVRGVGDSTQFIFPAPDTLVLLIKYDSGSVFFSRVK
jgi:heat shock protein HslJ